MIQLHRLHGNGTFVVNADLIELVEACPDTVVTLVNRHRYLVEETLEEVMGLVVDYRARITAAVAGSQDTSIAARVVASIDAEGERAA